MRIINLIRVTTMIKMKVLLTHKTTKSKQKLVTFIIVNLINTLFPTLMLKNVKKILLIYKKNYVKKLEILMK